MVREELSKGTVQQWVDQESTNASKSVRYSHTLNYANIQNPPIAQDLEKKFCRLGPKQIFLAQICVCKDISVRHCPAPQESHLHHQSWLECWGCRAYWLHHQAPLAALRSCETQWSGLSLPRLRGEVLDCQALPGQSSAPGIA